MRILLDCGGIKAGGGAQLAVTFLDHLAQHMPAGHRFNLLIPQSGPLAAFDHRRVADKTIHSPDSYTQRMRLEHGALQRFLLSEKIDAIFTFFGAGLPHPPAIKSLVSVAYPVICYPESLYWKNVSWKERLRVNALNCVRVQRLRQATTIITETEVMQERLCKLLRFPSHRVRVVPPAVTTHVRSLERAPEARARRFAFVSGNDTHKNLWRLFGIAKRAQQRGFDDFVFHLTVTREAYLRSVRCSPRDQATLDRHFVFLGSIPPQEIMRVYENTDCVVSLSDLESFSNNYMEAWKVGLPLLASDRDFSRSVCGASALYVDPHDADSVLAGMRTISEDARVRRRLIEEGRRRLELLPNLKQRTALVMAQLGAP
jgi:glycosyltransferase involved in cell wall biosynthesis